MIMRNTKMARRARTQGFKILAAFSTTRFIGLNFSILIPALCSPLTNTIPLYVTLSRQGLLEIISPRISNIPKLSWDAFYAPPPSLFFLMWNQPHLFFPSYFKTISRYIYSLFSSTWVHDRQAMMLSKTFFSQQSYYEIIHKLHIIR